MRRARWKPHAVSTIAALAFIAGCSGGTPEPPAHVAVGKPVHYVALGGDDVVGSRRRLTTSWPQLLFREHLEVNATLVNLASAHRGARGSVGIRCQPRSGSDRTS